MNDPRSTSARVVARECFWGDYQITAKELLDRLEADEPGFNRFLFSKIMENSSYPSRHIRALRSSSGRIQPFISPVEPA